MLPGINYAQQRMCLGTFPRLRRSLATSTLYAAVCILAERFLLYRKAISCKAKKERALLPHQNNTVKVSFLCSVYSGYPSSDNVMTKNTTPAIRCELLPDTSSS